MIILKSDNGVIKECDYPRNDYGLVVGLDEGIQYYYLEEIKPTNTNNDKYYLKDKEIVLTKEEHPEYIHLLKAIKEWELIEYSQAVVIQKLSNSLGEYLDSNYPTWKRTKHLRELQGQPTKEREAYINSLFAWEDRCRLERDHREDNYINNNIFPDLYNWELMPTV